MNLRLFNTLTHAKETLVPLDAPRVGLYTCGPTVYDHQHVGNYRTYVFEDVLVRALKLFGFAPHRVMNITDVGHLVTDGDDGEDKMEKGAAREGKTAWEIARLYTDEFLEDGRSLNLVPADVLCRATDFIPQQIDLVKRIEAKGYCYRTSDGVYFDTGKLADYGKLIPREHLAGILDGARVEKNPEKRKATDFALWKFSPRDRRRQMEWDSPWGRGFPGWHIECSAMAMHFLGETFDIHCGGIDHVPVHHTNEIAQSESASGKPFAKVWMHGEFLVTNNAKMAKSAGGFVSLADVRRRGYSPLDYRYLCLTAHYRKQLDFSWESLESAKTSRRRLSEAARAVADAPAAAEDPTALSAFREALADDLNAPTALAAVWDALKSPVSAGAKKAFLAVAESVLALDLLKAPASIAIPPAVAELLRRRSAAKTGRNFAEADRLRVEIEAMGFMVKDSKDGATAVPK